MVAAISATTTSTARQKTRPTDDSQRPPLAPSERDNGVARRPKGREINSRYLSSLTPTTSSSSSSTPRRCASPSRPVTPSPDRACGTTTKRAQSAERRRPSTASRPSTPVPAAVDNVKRAPEVLWPSTRSLSVSFQGESFSLPIGRRERTSTAARASSPAVSGTLRKSGTTPERRRSVKGGELAENSKPAENSRIRVEQQHRWPGVSSGRSVLTRSLDFTERIGRDPLARVLQQSVDESSVVRRASFDGRVNSDSGTADTSDNSALLDLASDTESVSSSSNSAGREPGGTVRRAVCTPARFLQEGAGGRLGRSHGLGSSLLEINAPKPRLTPARKSTDSPSSSPRTVSTTRSASSPIRGSSRPSSPSKYGISSCPPSRGMPSPLRNRASSTPALSSMSSSINSRSTDSFSSVLSLVDVRKVKKGVNLIEDAHLLRLLYNRHLQWRFVNARADVALATRTSKAKRILHNAWITTSKLRESVTFRRIKLQQLRQHAKLTAVLQGQMALLEEWSVLDRDHSCSLSGAIEALKASTLRLPVVGAAKADIQDVKEAVGSAVDVMQTMGSSICHLLSKVEGMNTLVSELADVASQGQSLLDECRDLFSSVATLQVEECSVRTHLLQLKRVHGASHNMS
ncbi:QWRF motif-containing protein 2-like [Nymphaea colorata]|nr:QWRF motif-containing protein 2-like [Nymphaea colorata]